MEAVVLLRPIGFGMMGFGVLLLAAPVIQVLRAVHPWRSVLGLWIAGWGFLLVGVGLGFADRGWGSAVLPGIVTVVVGHFIQSWVSRSSRRDESG